MHESEYAFINALLLLFQADSDLLEIISLSMKVSFSALLIAAVIGLPIGALLAVTRFRGRQLCLVISNTLMSMPPVVIGLIVYMLLSRSGPFGVFNLLYTPEAMVIAQVFLLLPIIISLSEQHLATEWDLLGEQLRSLGIHFFGICMTLLREARVPLVTVMLAGFGRAVSEIGAVMIVGGNIDHLTRVMTTAIALETNKGNLEMALALGTVLLLVSLAVNSVVHVIGNMRKAGRL